MLDGWICYRRLLSKPTLTWITLAMALLCCFCFAGHALGASFTASLDRDTITLGEGATLSLSFEGGTPDSVPPPPGSANLQVTGTGTSTQFTINNGQSTSTVIYNFRLTPRQPGDYTIPALTAQVAGQKLTSEPVTL